MSSPKPDHPAAVARPSISASFILSVSLVIGLLLTLVVFVMGDRPPDGAPGSLVYAFAYTGAVACLAVGIFASLMGIIGLDMRARGDRRG